jgi:hypothetical protein
MTILKTLLLMALFLTLAALFLSLFWLLERATRPGYPVVVRPGYYTEVGR